MTYDDDVIGVLEEHAGILEADAAVKMMQVLIMQKEYNTRKILSV